MASESRFELFANYVKLALVVCQARRGVLFDLNIARLGVWYLEAYLGNVQFLFYR